MIRFVKKIHMVGIGGAGMSPLAEVLVSRGHRVTGSDSARSESTRHLENKGIKIQYGHDVVFVRDADLLVYSSAVSKNNPERMYAAERGIAQIRRAEVLGGVMRSGFTICIAGTHGKTTTTSLVGTVLTDAQLTPTVLVGGMLKSAGSHAIVGTGDVIVAEADEYDRSFLAMYPSIAVITNIEADHLDCYRDIDDIKETFVKFTEIVPFDGAVIACIDDEGVRDILPNIRRSVVSYGIDNNADYRAINIVTDKNKIEFDVAHKNNTLGNVSINIPGLHNVRNALAAVAVARELGINFETIKKSIASFQGVKRRFEILGVANGVTVVDDYAHHPGEIAATLAAAKTHLYKRIIAIFQPHLYSRTRDFMDDFARSLSAADFVIVTGIYKSRETPIDGVCARDIVDRINAIAANKAVYVDDKDDVYAALENIIDNKFADKNIVSIDNVADKNVINKNVVGKNVIDNKLTDKNIVANETLLVFMGAGDIGECAYKYLSMRSE